MLDAGYWMLDKDKGKEICFAVDKVEKLSAAEMKSPFCEIDFSPGLLEIA